MKFEGFVFTVLLCYSFTLADECQTNGKCTEKQENGTLKKLQKHEETITEISKPKTPPKSMSMLAEDMDQIFQPTPVPKTTTNNSTSSANLTTSEEPKGRALNFTMEEQSGGNVLSQNVSHDEFGDLSDVSISNEDDEEIKPKVEKKMLVEKEKLSNKTMGKTCEKGGLTYEHGETLENDCDSVCKCQNGKMNCTDRCTSPFIKKDKKIDDSTCSAKEADDPCCATLVCTTTESAVEPFETCSFNNKTYQIGDTIKKDCSELCTCEPVGKLNCNPRCAPANKTFDRCVEVPDPSDTCCKKVLCDVTLDDHEPEKEEERSKIKVLSAKFINTTTILLKFDPKIEEKDLPIIDISDDKNDWKSYQMLQGGYLFVKTNAKYLRLDNSEDIIEVEDRDLGPKDTDTIIKETTKKPLEVLKDDLHCEYKGKKYEIGEEYNDDCKSLCACQKDGMMQCLKLECPTYFGTDILDPQCVVWETVPPNFKPKSPNCCPSEVRCKNNGSCLYDGQNFKNWEQLPINITGCEKRCYCEMELPHNSTKANDNDFSEESYFGTPEKKPSKILGPLLVYSNDNKQHKVLPKEENPFYNNHFKSEQDNVFVTPPTLPEKNHVPFKIQKNPSKNQLQVNEKSTPEEILQFIHQHPEITNYPSGSVLEIHNIPFGNPQDQKPSHYQDPRLQYHNRPQYQDQQYQKQSHNIPILGNQNNLLSANSQDLPQGVTLEQILQEIHKNVNPIQQKPFLIAQQTGLSLPPSPPRQNKTGQVNGFPSYPNIPGFPGHQDDVTVTTLEAIDAHTVRLAFMVPPVIVGLHGRVEVRYTHKNDEDLNLWELQVFAPPNDLIATPQLEFDLLGLKPNTEYKIKITITLRDLHNTPSSRIYKIRTQKDVQTTTLPPMIPIEPDLAITDINATWVTVVWRKFTEYELQFIDGVQLSLKPNTKYEIGIFFIPFPGQLTELHAENMLHFTTANEIDTYGFNVTLEISQLKSQSVEITWNGVPYPEDKYVNIYRAIYQSDSDEEENLLFGEYYLEEVEKERIQEDKNTEATEDSMAKLLEKLMNQQQNYECQNLQKVSERFILEKFSTKSSNAQQWIQQFQSWSQIRYALAFRYEAGSPLEYAVKKERLLLEERKTIDTGTLIDLIAAGLPNFIADKIDRDSLQETEDLFNEIGKLEHLTERKRIDKLSRGEQLENKGDYYGPLVIVAILAAIAILSTLILLLILVRRHNQNKAAITTPSTRISQSAYDNPTYKVEIQQETMGL
ncbi:unnamed protein product [Brassicogethes aeneus]|uniref:VWFC domain-containing protein n=1 Tax=Brassicogethes aeneus TaxID=1431903 RepID=A0A9P0AYL3_BRAAE|nr:unnamed protein product [Brassicogethes aeneus]